MRDCFIQIFARHESFDKTCIGPILPSYLAQSSLKTVGKHRDRHIRSTRDRNEVHQYLQSWLIRQFECRCDAIKPPRPIEDQPFFPISGFKDFVVRGAILELNGKVDAVGVVPIDEDHWSGGRFRRRRYSRALRFGSVIRSGSIRCQCQTTWRSEPVAERRYSPTSPRSFHGQRRIALRSIIDQDIGAPAAPPDPTGSVFNIWSVIFDWSKPV